MRTLGMADRAGIRFKLVVSRAWWAYLPLIVMLAMGCAFWAGLAWEAAELPIVRSVFVLLSMGLLAVAGLVVRRTLALLDDANWLLMVTDTAIVLNPIDASGRTHGEPVELPFTEIVSLRKLVEKRLAVGDHSIEDVHDRHVYLEVALADVDSSPLLGFPPPLVLEKPRTLKIGWRDRATRLTPSLAVFLATLPPTIARQPDAGVQWGDSRTLGDDELWERVRALCAGNDKLGAIKVLRAQYAMGLREAKDLVERLSASSSASAR